MEIPIDTEHLGSVFNHGKVTIEENDVERELDVDVQLAVAGDDEKTPDEVALDFASELEDLVQKYAI